MISLVDPDITVMSFGVNDTAFYMTEEELPMGMVYYLEECVRRWPAARHEQLKGTTPDRIWRRFVRYWHHPAQRPRRSVPIKGAKR